MSAAGLKVPGYVVDRLIGRGSSSEVWAARVAGSIDQVALKRVSVSGRAQLGVVRHEAAILRALDHPYLVRLHEVVPIRDGAVLVLDLADAGSLASVLAARGRITVGEVVTTLAPVAGALAYVHTAGVVHGDVSAGNVLFAAAGYPLLADLGLARLAGSQDAGAGTPAYLDPAVAAGAFPAPASDVFSLAAVAYHALTGTTVWPGMTGTDMLAAAALGRFSDLEIGLLDAAVPSAVRLIVLRGLHREPRQRGTVADFGLDLRSVADPMPVELAAGRYRVEPSLSAEPSSVAALTPADVPRSEPRPAHSPSSRSRRRGGHAAPARHAAPTRSGRTQHRPAPPPTPLAPMAAPTRGDLFTEPVVARPRPDVGRRARRRRRLGVSTQWLAVAGAALVVLGGSATAWALLSDRSPHPAAAPAPLVLTSTDLGVGPVPGVGELSSTVASLPTSSQGVDATGTASAGSSSGLVDAALASTLLVQLDALRERAFATRTTLLLTGVYLPGTLLSQDETLLERLVPAGCGLQGVRTTYTAVQVVSQTATSVRLSANAQLSASVLVCNGKVTAQAAGTKPTATQLTLVRRGPNYAIAAVTR